MHLTNIYSGPKFTSKISPSTPSKCDKTVASAGPSDKLDITFKDVAKAGVESIKKLPKAFLNHTIGCGFAAVGALGGVLYSATLVGPLVVSAANSKPKRPPPSRGESTPTKPVTSF